MKDTPRTDKKIFEHPSGYEVVISELAYQLILELTAARAEMHKSIEERREESMKATAARSGLEMWKRCSQKAEQELVTVTKQLDRLAEALREIKSELGVPQPEYPAPVANAVKIAEQALQSLTTNAPTSEKI